MIIVTMVFVISSVAVSSQSPIDGHSHTLWDKLTFNQFKHLVAGGVAGAVSRTSVSPLERMKILYQVSKYI